MTFKDTLNIRVRPASSTTSGQSHLAILTFNGKEYKCAVGRNGIGHKQSEGDGITPIGEFPLRMCFYRSDRIKSETLTNIKGLALVELKLNYGWCDDMFDQLHYNRLIQYPTMDGLSFEKLWRVDELYDLFAVIGFNDNPIRLGRGSAIFFHIASENYGPTSGCVALKREDLIEVLSQLTPFTIMKIDLNG